MSGFMKRVFKNSRPYQAFFFLSKGDDKKLKEKSVFVLLHSFIFFVYRCSFPSDFFSLDMAWRLLLAAGKSK